MGSDGLKLAIAMKWLGASDVTWISKRHFAAKKSATIFTVLGLYIWIYLKKISPGNVGFRKYDATDSLFLFCICLWAPSTWTVPRWETPKFFREWPETLFTILLLSVDCNWFGSNNCFWAPHSSSPLRWQCYLVVIGPVNILTLYQQDWFKLWRLTFLFKQRTDQNMLSN